MKRKSKAIKIMILGLIAAFLLCACGTSAGSEKTNEAEIKSKSDPEGVSFDKLDLAEGEIGLIETVTYPEGYTTEEADEKGSIQEISYLVDASGNAASAEDAETYEKTAVLYLPYGYNEEEKYNVVYVAHGMGGTQYSFPGKPGEPESSAFIRMIDHMIEDELIEPLIMVFPTITPSVGEEEDNYEDQLLNVYQNELVSTLIPLIEGNYSSYAESVDEAGLKASRDHRCMSGFSMGGCLTWRMLWHETGYFRYYMPFSMIADYHNISNIADTTEFMYHEMKTAGYSGKDYNIYAACGTEDYTNLYVRKQIEDMLQYSDMFSYSSSGWSGGNLMYAEWPDHTHKYTESYPYFFCGLLRCFPTEKTRAYMQSVDAEASESQ